MPAHMFIDYLQSILQIGMEIKCFVDLLLPGPWLTLKEQIELFQPYFPVFWTCIVYYLIHSRLFIQSLFLFWEL